jgi:hypothetical protein
MLSKGTKIQFNSTGLKRLNDLTEKCFPHNSPRPTRDDFAAADAELQSVNREEVDPDELFWIKGKLGRYEHEVNPTWRSAHKGPVERWTSV